MVAVIWTFNPKLETFLTLLRSVVKQVDHLVVIDNGSDNAEFIRNACALASNLTFIENRRNLGVRALNIAMRYAIEKSNPNLILLLDQDTLVHPSAITTVRKSIESLEPKLYDAIGALQLSPIKEEVQKDIFKGLRRFVSMRFQKYLIFSGCIVKAEPIRKGARLREEFFLDQADFDFYDRIRRLGFLVVPLRVGGNSIIYKVGADLSGKGIRIPLLGMLKSYQPPWRYYYIVRNSTVLLLEGRMDLLFYAYQLFVWGISLMFVRGICTAMHVLLTGLSHGIFKKLGYLDPRVIERLSR